MSIELKGKMLYKIPKNVLNNTDSENIDLSDNQIYVSWLKLFSKLYLKK